MLQLLSISTCCEIENNFFLVLFNVLDLPSCVWPVDIIVSLTRWPADVAIVDLATSPEVSLPVLCNQTKEVVLLSSAVKTDGSHSTLRAESLSITLFELRATNTPTDQKILTLNIFQL